VGISLPAHGAQSLHGEDRNTVRKDRQPVLLGLDVKHLPAGQGNQTGGDVVLRLELLGGVQGDTNLGTGRDDGDVSILRLLEDVASLNAVRDRRVFELGKVLSGKSDDGRSVHRRYSNVVACRYLVTVGRAPHHAVG
jgi:hypothetical protein